MKKKKKHVSKKKNKKYALDWASEDGFYWIYFKQLVSALGAADPK